MAEVKADSRSRLRRCGGNLRLSYAGYREPGRLPVPMHSLGKGGYNVHLLGAVTEEPSWQGGYQQAHTQQDGWWNTEIAIPLARLGAGAQGRQATDGLWAVNSARLEARLGMEQPQRRVPALRPPLRIHGRACARRAF